MSRYASYEKIDEDAYRHIGDVDDTGRYIPVRDTKVYRRAQTNLTDLSPALEVKYLAFEAAYRQRQQRQDLRSMARMAEKFTRFGVPVAPETLDAVVELQRQRGLRH
jgi:hypothetical protein